MLCSYISKICNEIIIHPFACSMQSILRSVAYFLDEIQLQSSIDNCVLQNVLCESMAAWSACRLLRTYEMQDQFTIFPLTSEHQ